MNGASDFDWEPVVRETETLNLTGNIVPHHWYSTILLPNGKPDIVGIILLSEIVYWWRPKATLNSRNGKLEGYEKKFAEDMLQRSAQGFADQFGFTKRQVQDALRRLEQLGLIIRQYRSIMTRYDQIVSNVLFIAPVVPAIAELDQKIEFIEEEEVEEGGSNQIGRPSYARLHSPPRSVTQGAALKRDTYNKEEIKTKITQRATASSKVNAQPDDSVKNPAVAFSGDKSLTTKQTQLPHQPPPHHPKPSPVVPPSEVPPDQQVIGDSLTEFQLAHVKKKLAILAQQDSSIELDRYCQGVGYELVSKTSFSEAGEDFLKKLNTILKYIRAGKWHFPVGLDKEITEQRIAEHKGVEVKLSELTAERDSLKRMIDFVNPSNTSQLESLHEQLVSAEKRLQVFRQTLPNNPPSQQGVA